jgi:16S rRNA (guanine527-N7)-methyltransferase
MATDPRLVRILERARSLGFLGPGPVEDHVTHATGFLAGLAEVAGVVVDLGSGGGVPGLVVVAARPDLEVVLLDALAKRCRFLEQAVEDLGAASRTRVAEGRAEVLGRTDLRGTASAVRARSFGPPAATAECAAPLLRAGGRLLVSEPPAGADRWPAGPLRPLGLEPGGLVSEVPKVRVLHQVAPCGDEFPRRDGIPTKRPLF